MSCDRGMVDRSGIKTCQETVMKEIGENGDDGKNNICLGDQLGCLHTCMTCALCSHLGDEIAKIMCVLYQVRFVRDCSI